MTQLQNEDGPLFAPTWVHTAGEVPERGLEITREADEDERARLAQALDARGCPDLRVSYKVIPRSGGRYRVSGRIAATLVQRCVVTLAPVTTTLDERLEVEFRPVEIDDFDESTPDPAADFNRDYEPMRRGVIDIGRVVYEQIAAVLDPYPRAAGATFQWTDPKQRAGDDVASTAPTQDAPSDGGNPFAVLRRLKGES
jgi:uncharacterized protein